MKPIVFNGGDEFEDWIQTSVAGEDGHPGHSIYCRSISFLLFARMLDNIELENHVHSIQDRLEDGQRDAGLLRPLGVGGRLQGRGVF